MIDCLSAEELSCRRGGRIVLSGVSFTVRGGDALLLRGPNGAGKTTLLRTLAGFIGPGSGVLEFQARGVPLAPGEQQEMLHYVGHLGAVKPRLTVLENIVFWQRFYSGAADAEAAEDALDHFGLLHLADFPAGHLSAGQTRRLALARLLAAPRSLWLLDEPSSSLDDVSTARLEQAIARHLAAGGLAVIATHTPLAVPAQTLSLPLQTPRAYEAA